MRSILSCIGQSIAVVVDTRAGNDLRYVIFVIYYSVLEQKALDVGCVKIGPQIFSNTDEIADYLAVFVD